MMAGARPVFADIDPERLTLDPAAVAALIGPRTAAVLPVHLYGQPADLAAIRMLTRRHGLALIEDCCQSHLATCDGVPVGTTGVAAAYSFYPTKNLGAFGDGGAVCTGDAQLAARIRRLRNGGQTARDHHIEPASHSRLDELQAAVLRARLRICRPGPLGGGPWPPGTGQGCRGARCVSRLSRTPVTCITCSRSGHELGTNSART